MASGQTNTIHPSYQHLNLRIRDFLDVFAPPPGRRLWYGGASLFGTLRGVNAVQAVWKPEGYVHSIWELALHCAYARYNIRRSFEGRQERGGFPRKGGYWPGMPDPADEAAWKQDVALLKEEQLRLVEAVRGFDASRLEELATQENRYIDLLWGIIMHDLVHVGEMGVIKHLYGARQIKVQTRPE